MYVAYFALSLLFYCIMWCSVGFVNHVTMFGFERTVYYEYSLNVKHNVNICEDIYSYENCVVSTIIDKYCLIICS